MGAVFPPPVSATQTFLSLLVQQQNLQDQLAAIGAVLATYAGSTVSVTQQGLTVNIASATPQGS